MFYFKWLALLLMIGTSSGCGSQGFNSEDFSDYVKSHKVGAGNDYMLEMINNAGEWEPVMFVFGYFDNEGTRIECQNAADGLKKVNYLREYRCVLAN
jgi:hypothetical protein